MMSSGGRAAVGCMGRSEVNALDVRFQDLGLCVGVANVLLRMTDIDRKRNTDEYIGG